MRALAALSLAISWVGMAQAAATQPGDPVSAFVADADSVHAVGGDQALAGWLTNRPDLAGAAVAHLVDEAVQAADIGDESSENAKLTLARALARAWSTAAPTASTTLALEEAAGWNTAARSHRREAKALEAQAETARRDGRPDEAVALLHEAESIYERLPDTHSRAIVWGSLGVAHWARADWPQVEAAYQRALELRRHVGDRILEGRTLNGLGSVQFQLGRYAEALEWYDLASEVRRGTGDLAGLGTTLTYAANCHLSLGHLLEARRLYEEALPVLERIGRPTQVVETLNGIANLHHQVGRYRDAATRYHQALDLCDATDDCGFGPLLRVNLGMTLRYQGELHEALRTLEVAADRLGKDGDPALRIQLAREFGLTAIALGDRDAAREHLLTAVRLARESGDKGQQADGLVNLGTLYLQIDAVPQGLRAAGEARALAEELGDVVRLRDALSVEGEAQMRAGAYELAAESFRYAREIDESAGALSTVAYDEIGLGGALSRLARRGEARARLRRAATLLERTGREDQVWVALLGLGDTFEEERPDSAVWYYDRALARLESSRQAVGGLAMQTGYLFAHRGRAYEEIARYYAKQQAIEPEGGWAARAFLTAERAKSRGLLDLLDRSFAQTAGPEADALLDSLYLADASTAEGRVRRDRLQRRLAVLRDRHTEGSARSGLPRRNVAPLPEVQAGLPKHGVLLQYAVGDSTTLLWVVTPRSATLLELPPRGELRSRVQQMRDAIAQPGAGDDALLRSARDLYRTLIEPADDVLAEARHVVIVPDDALFELPFEALLQRDPLPGQAWGRQPFWGRDIAPVYAPSSTIYLELAGRTPDRDAFDMELLAVGAPDYAGLGPRSGPAGAALTPLPAARDELLAIGATVDDQRKLVLLGPQASESAFKQALRDRRPRVVHLATHGLIDPIEPARSCVALAAGDDDEDGYLYSLEVLSLPLRDTLVVLSACESARGRLERGEGAVGLTRAFLAAGARGTIASLWPVSDASTSYLMQTFYQRLLRRREGAAEALGHARRALMASAEWGHPFHWAPFVVVGSERMPW